MFEILSTSERWSKLGGMKQRDMACHFAMVSWHILVNQLRVEVLGAAGPLPINKATVNTTSELQANLTSLHCTHPALELRILQTLTHSCSGSPEASQFQYSEEVSMKKRL